MTNGPVAVGRITTLYDSNQPSFHNTYLFQGLNLHQACGATDCDARITSDRLLGIPGLLSVSRDSDLSLY